MPSTVVLSAAVSAKLMARIRELVEDGLSDSAIVRAIRKEANTNKSWPLLTFQQIKTRIHTILEECETESETSEPSFDSDEEDEEWVAPSESESESSESEESEESEESSESEETEESSETSSDSEEVHEPSYLRIFFDHLQEGELDRLIIEPIGEGLFKAEMAYDLTSSFAYPRRANFFEGDVDTMASYIADILRLVAIDKLPYKSLEFAVPFYPTVSLTPHTLRKKSSRKLVKSVIQQYLEHYAQA